MLQLRSIVFVAALSLPAACVQRPQPPLPAPPPATVTSFTVTPSSLDGPGEVVLEWGTTNASAISIEQVGKGPIDVGTDLSGRRAVRVDADAVFLITAQGAGGSDLRASSVVLARRALSVLFSSVPSTVEAGGSATLVWNAPGARAVRLDEVGGPRLELGTQLESGSVRVTPKRTTTYRLTADDVTATTTVSVAPTITLLTAGATLPAAGEPVTIRWETASASSVTLRRIGLAMPFTLPAGQVETGSYTDTVPGNLPPDAVLTYVLEATSGNATVSRSLEVFVGGGVQISRFTAPAYALSGTTFPVSWTTLGAQSAELIVDGRRVFLATSAAEVATGSYSLPAPTQSTRIEFIARNARGAEARESRTVEGVGPLSFNFFVADKTMVTTAGEPVTLTWSITNARNVRITSNTASGFYREFTGNVDTGSLVVLPNRFGTFTRITYRLEADNGTGSSPIVRTVDIDLGPAAQVTFTFPRQLPVGAPTTVTGTSLTTSQALRGFKAVEKNPTGEAFIDIRRTGTAVTFASTSDATNVALPAAFDVTLFGSRFSRSRLNISKFGWFNLSTSTLATAGRPDNGARFEAFLEPFTIAPYWNNLVTASGQVHWRVDSVADARRLIVQWSNVRPTNGPIDARLTFQAQLYSNGKVVLAYRDFFKVQGQGTAGVVNGTETDELSPSMPVAAGDVYRLFGSSMPPVSLRAEVTPYAGSALVGGDVIELEGQGNIPPNLISVTEINSNPPSGVTNGQWLEITNTSDAGFDLSGWDLDFGSAASFQFPMGTTVAPGGLLLVGQSADLGDPGPAGGITIDDGGVVPRPTPDAIIPATLSMPSTGGFARLGFGGTEYNRLTYPAQLVGTSYGLESLRAPWLISQSQTRTICESVRWSYGTNNQVGSPGLANGPCWPYRPYQVIPGNFQALASNPAATRITFGTTTTPDTSTTIIDFTAAGRTPLRAFGLAGGISTVLASADGYLVIGGSSFCCDNTALPSTANRVWVAPFWDDLQGNLGSGLYLLQTGTAPNVTTIISWESWSFFPQTSYTGTTINFQVHFLPNGDIEFHYGPSTVGSGTDAAALVQGSSASIWLEAVTVADAYAARTTDAIVPTTNAVFNGLGIRYVALRR
ncbi:MAG: lamin tail domain-containing protein [Myxococcaceae bacterium]|nr:lamin tail domain-containing protein [Myxococcaceae bacterium]